MRKSLLVLTAIFSGLLFACTTHAQVQVFGGYSYLRPTVTTISCPAGELPPCAATSETTHPNLNGWEASGTFNPFHVLGFTADFGGNYGTVAGSTIHVQTYLVGPQVHFPGPVSPFAHVLVGAAHESVSGSNEMFFPSSGNAFATAVGGGIDIKVAPFVSLRVIQLDYLVTRFGSTTQNQPRASAGIVVHF
jgi:hypothetical protein